VEHSGKSIGAKLKSTLVNDGTIEHPGPGQYSPEKKDKSFAFSMGMRYKHMDSTLKHGVPGPG
jgi:hypothetical protein